MGYRVYSFGRKDHHGSEADEFFEAAEMARRSVEKMHHLASEMEDRYGEMFYGMRYGMREYPEHEMMYGRHYDGWEDDMYGDRRMRDSRGRYR